MILMEKLIYSDMEKMTPKYSLIIIQAIYSVSRGSLNCILLDMAEGLNIKLHFDT